MQETRAASIIGFVMHVDGMARKRVSVAEGIFAEANNKPLVARMPSVFSSTAKNAAPGMTSYLAITGPGGTFDRVAPRTITEIADGMSNTVAVIEASGSLAVPWTRPDDFVYVAEKPMEGLVGQHPGGFLALACDGAVHFISETLDPKLLVALFTCAGNEVIPRGTLD